MLYSHELNPAFDLINKRWFYDFIPFSLVPFEIVSFQKCYYRVLSLGVISILIEFKTMYFPVPQWTADKACLAFSGGKLYAPKM